MDTTDTDSEPSASVARRLAALAVPTFGQLIAEPVFILIDTAIVGHVSDAALAGLSLGSSIILTAVGLCVFLAYSTTSHVARLFGAGKRKEGLQAGMDGLWLALAIGLALALLLFMFASPLCAALGGSGDTHSQAVLYVRTVVLGVPGMLLVYAANGIFRGLQKVSLTLVAAVGGAALNTVLDVLFVIVFGWGIAGSGIATAIAQWFMGLYLIFFAVRWAVQGGASLRPHASGIVAAGSEGLPLFFRTLALRGALMASVVAATVLGTEVLAGYQIVNATWNFALNILDSIAIAGQTLVGAQLGARSFARARQLTRFTARAGLMAGFVVGICFVLLGFVAGRFFSPNPDVQQLACAGMVAIGIFMPLQGWMWALDGILIGAGDFRYLAMTCAASAVAYVIVLSVFIVFVVPILSNDVWCIALLWGLLGLVLMGGRGIANGVRARGEAWMRVGEDCPSSR